MNVNRIFTKCIKLTVTYAVIFLSTHSFSDNCGLSCCSLAEERSLVESILDLTDSETVDLAKLAGVKSELDMSQLDAFEFFDTFLVKFKPKGRVSDRLKSACGAVYKPGRGDLINWVVTCEREEFTSSEGCIKEGYGVLIANAQRVNILEKTGSAMFFGSRSTGESLEHESPIGYCREMRYDLQNNGCTLSVSIERSKREILIELLDRMDDETCELIEATYDKSCNSLQFDLRE